MEFRYKWEWEVQATPEHLWPYVADTDRFNRDTGLPAVTVVELLPGGRKKLSYRKYGVPIEWVEEPFEWEWPKKYSVVRRFARGPLAKMTIRMSLEDKKLIYGVQARPRNILGLIGIPVQIGIISKQKFGEVIQRYDRMARNVDLGFKIEGKSGEIKLEVGARRRMEEIRSKLGDKVDKLIEYVKTADDMEVSRMRAYELADRWKMDRKGVLKLCLQATRLGLLEFEWDVLCPMCRGVKQKADNLTGINEDAHCESCNIDFKVNLERYVEITFHPNPDIRPVIRAEYCVGGPRLTSHIFAQFLLRPSESRIVGFGKRLPEGRYRWRQLGELQVSNPKHQIPMKSQVTRLQFSKPWKKEKLVNGNARWRIENDTKEEQLVVFERTAWSDTATTAAEIFALQTFRDLFASEALRPGEKVSVGSLSIVFTDLKGSTAMYRQIGDAVAFGKVMAHFDVLRQVVDKYEGAIVKTIGDAIMAVFVRPKMAVQAMLEAQDELRKAFNAPDLRLKAGVHFGPCIAVNLNDRLDYFGSTVNLASRLEGQSDAQGIIITKNVAEDPEVKEWINDKRKSINVSMYKSKLKGFEEEFELFKVTVRRGRDSNPR